MKHSLICTADAGRPISGSELNRRGPRLEGIFPLLRASHSGLLQLGTEKADELSAAISLGRLRARLQHAVALEMLWRQRKAQVEAAREWRTIIKLPKYTNSVDGTLALQRLGGDAAHRDEVSRLLAREYVVWQITRAREKSDGLIRLVREGRATIALVRARAAEIQELSLFPSDVLSLAINSTKLSANEAVAKFKI